MKNQFAMNRLLAILLLLVLIACKPKVETLPKEIADQFLTSFVLNPNGIAYYKDPTDLKSKIGVIPYQAMFGREEDERSYGEEDKPVVAIKILYNGKEGFIIYKEDSIEFKNDVISFEREIPSRISPFGVVESEAATLYNSPFVSSRILERLNRFSMVELVAKEVPIQTDWVRFFYKGEYVYAQANVQKYPSRELAKQAIQKKALNESGYVKIKSEKATFLSNPDLKKVKGSKDSLLSPVWDLYPSHYSQLVGDKRYYLIQAYDDSKNEYLVRRGKKNIILKENPFKHEYLFISEDNIEYIPDEKHSEYTIEHTNYKGDKKILYAIAKQFSEDFTNVTINQLGKTEKGESLYLVQFENSSRLFKRSDGIYQEAEGYEYGWRVVPGSIQDIDGDGLSEFLVIWDGRGAVGYTLYGMKNGEYKPLADVDNISDKTNGIIRQVNFITDEDEYPFYKEGFQAYGSFRYDKGNFIPVKIKYKRFKRMGKKRKPNIKEKDSDETIEN